MQMIPPEQKPISEKGPHLTITRRGDRKVRDSMNSNELNYETLKDQQRHNNALKQKVDLLREQASINM